MQRTIGLDFGTHQTKICVEEIDRHETSYEFMKFKSANGEIKFALPSIIGIDSKGLLHYGFLSSGFKGKIIRYFKQKTFRAQSLQQREDNMYYSIWYIAYIIFMLEKQYEQDFAFQMGVPSDSDANHLIDAKRIATRIIISAYQLVEDILENDFDAFLNLDINTLKGLTEILPYSDKLKEEYLLNIFPEAFACLNPLTSQGKIERGMSLIIDIGGGTTDISFFTIPDGKPQVYALYSLNKGLNYLTCADDKENYAFDSNVNSQSELDNERIKIYFDEIERVCWNIERELIAAFRRTHLPQQNLREALEERPLIYCGGGSTFNRLVREYRYFTELKKIAENDWKKESVKDLEEIRKRNLFSILSTAYGLSISVTDDTIEMTPLKSIFDHIASEEAQQQQQQQQPYTHPFSYADQDAWK